jgi:hypothetical protein
MDYIKSAMEGTLALQIQNFGSFNSPKIDY